MFCYIFSSFELSFFRFTFPPKYPSSESKKKKKSHDREFPFFPRKAKISLFFFFSYPTLRLPSQASQIDLSRSRKTNLLVPTISSNKECLTGSLCYINLVLISYKKHQQTPHLGLFKIEFWIRITSQFLSRINFD